MLFFKTKKDFIKLPIGLLLAIIGGLSPLIIGMVGGYLTELLTNRSCHEGNCFFGALPWLMFLTIPVATLIFIIILIIAIIDLIKLRITLGNNA